MPLNKFLATQRYFRFKKELLFQGGCLAWARAKLLESRSRRFKGIDMESVRSGLPIFAAILNSRSPTPKSVRRSGVACRLRIPSTPLVIRDGRFLAGGICRG